ncbi:hypothetical protein FRC16_001964 [Serendipita sp. 398]|nr:hypothetical protein FRC16_001964 [Serendipita sp. 398]
MHPYQHPPSSGGQSGPSASQQFLDNVETAAGRLRRVFGKKRPSQTGHEDGTQSEAPISRKLVPGPRVSTLFSRKDSKPSLQFPSSTLQALGHRLNKSSSRVSYISEDRTEASVSSPPPSMTSKRSEDRQSSPPTTLTVPSQSRPIQRTSGLVPGPETSAAIEYILESSNGSPVSSSPPRAPRVSTSPRNARSGSFDDGSALPSPNNTGKRRSMSLSMIPSFAPPNYPPPSAATTPPSSFSFASKPNPSANSPHHRSQSALPVFSDILSASIPSEAKPATADANGIMATPSKDKTSHNFRGKLSAWATPPSQARSSSREASPSHSKAASVVASIGPAATAATGLAMNFSRKAYEKVNSIWTPVSAHSPQPSKQGVETFDSTFTKNKRVNGASYGGSQSDVEISSRRVQTQTDMSAGPNLGTLLRPPFRKTAEGGGLVFGRSLVDCVRDTKSLVVLGAEVEAGIEARFIPALVLRCVQHIERWGIKEEGVFRITGRISHINKLRSEFGRGADYDLQECGPGDLDPHAVASVLKAFLRELPEPILTRVKAPLFEAAFNRAKDGGFMLAGAPSAAPRNFHPQRVGLPSGPRQGLPSSPRDSHLRATSMVTLRPSEQQMANDPPNDACSPQEALHTLLEEFHDLTSSLSRENKDLLLTIAELLQKVSQHSQITKMPLSNLLLVLCPSMSMNPGVLKVFVEHFQPIFFGVPALKTTSKPAIEKAPPSVDQDGGEGQEIVVGLTHEVFSRLSPEPIPTDRLPTRKQSLRNRPDGSHQHRTTPNTTPSAYKDTFPPITPPAEPRTARDFYTPPSNPSSRAPSPRQMSFNPSDTNRPKPPMGPRPQNGPPSPLSLPDRSHHPFITPEATQTSSQESKAAYSPRVIGFNSVQAPLTAANDEPLDLTTTDRQTKTGKSDNTPNRDAVVNHVEVIPSHDAHLRANGMPLAPSALAQLLLADSSLPSAPTSNASPPILHEKQEAGATAEINNTNLVDVQTTQVTLVKSTNTLEGSGNTSVPERLQMHLPPLEHLESGLSSASSANTDATADIFNTSIAWPEVPKGVPVPDVTDGLGNKQHAISLEDVEISLPETYQTVASDVEDAICNSAEATNGHQPFNFGPVITSEPPTQQYDHRRDGSLSTITNVNHFVQSAPSSAVKPPDRSGLDYASTQSSPESHEPEGGDYLSPRGDTIRIQPPRLTVNSKELLSGDSFWAKELQRAIQSTSPPSPVERTRPEAGAPVF